MYGRGTLDTEILIIKPLKGELSDFDLYDDVRPYLVVKVGEQEQQTETETYGGRSPRWNTMMEFPLRGYESSVTLTLYSESSTGYGEDELLSSTIESLEPLKIKKAGMKVSHLKDYRGHHDKIWFSFELENFRNGRGGVRGTRRRHTIDPRRHTIDPRRSMAIRGPPIDFSPTRNRRGVDRTNQWVRKTFTPRMRGTVFEHDFDTRSERLRPGTYRTDFKELRRSRMVGNGPAMSAIDGLPPGVPIHETQGFAYTVAPPKYKKGASYLTHFGNDLKLSFTAKNAKFVKDHDFFTKMDPYLIIRFGDQEEKTSEAEGEGMEPVCNTFVFDLSGTNTDGILYIGAYDKDRWLKDNFIGSQRVFVKDLLKHNGDESYPIYFYKDAKYAGKLDTKLEFFGETKTVLNSLTPLEYSPDARLMIYPKEAQFPKSLTFLGLFSMNPYITVNVGDKNQARTRVSETGDKNPEFNDNMVFKLKGDEISVDVKCFDKKRFGDDTYIADAKIELEELVVDGKGGRWFELQREFEHFGRVYLEWVFQGQFRRKERERAVFTGAIAPKMVSDAVLQPVRAVSTKVRPSTPMRHAERPPIPPMSMDAPMMPIRRQRTPPIRPRRERPTYRPTPTPVIPVVPVVPVHPRRRPRFIVEQRVLTPSPERLPISVIERPITGPGVLGSPPTPTPILRVSQAQPLVTPTMSNHGTPVRGTIPIARKAAF